MNDPIALFGLTTNLFELVSFVLSLITVILNIRQNHLAWAFAILSSATYGIVFFNARLYGDMALQGMFIVVSLWGWYQWLYGGVNHHTLRVSHCDSKGYIYSVVVWLGLFGLFAWYLTNHTDTDVPNIDGFLTAGSLIGQILLSRKKVENWIIWIIVDILYVGLYVYKGLMLTAILYAIFIVLAVIGLLAWRRAAIDSPKQ